jgi:hypothetical protein
MIIEVGYSYQYDKNSPVETGWTYFHVRSDDVKKAKDKAKLLWKKFLTELGWTKKAKIIHIEEIQNEKSYVPDFIIVSKSELPPARKRTSRAQTPQKASPRKSPSRRVPRKT